MILLDSGASSSIVLGKHTRKLCHKNTQPVKWITQGGAFLTTYKTNVELLLPEWDAMKSATLSFHVDDSQKSSRYDMIIGQYLLLEIKLDLCFSNYTIKGNGGAYKGCTAPMKYYFDLCDDASFRNEEWRENDHVLDSTKCTRRILDANYQRADLSKILSNSKHLNNNKQSILRDVLNKYELLFDGDLGTFNTEPVDIELQPGAKNYNAKPYSVLRSHKSVLRK